MDAIARLTIMVAVSDTARADIALTPERIYYRFATDEAIEDGELPAAKEDFTTLAVRILSNVTARDNEKALPDDVRLTIFVNNRKSDITVSEESLRRMVDELHAVADEFTFLKGFC